MRGVLVVSCLLGCGAPGKKATEPAPLAPSCKRAAEHIVDELVGGKDPRPPDDDVNAYIKMISTRCEQDGWSTPAQDCFTRIKSLADADTCGTMLTQAQQDALVRDQARR
ncbi:MAG TPA: hypothetical protein VM513_13255 [Kofleriaceae bacterium]|nr:hypothetical protein [Kofleriaceae bacterium]